jgi:hypothetical protein
MTTSSQNLLVIVFHVEEKQAFRNIYWSIRLFHPQKLFWV